MTAVARAAQPKDYKALPSVDRLLGSEAFLPLIARFGRQEVVAATRALLGREREALTLGEPKADWSPEALATRVALDVEQRLAPRFRRVINLTGTVLHTNLGRALLPVEAVQAVADAMTSASNLEYDIASGGRGDRDDLVAPILSRAHGVRGGHDRQQQRGRGAARAQHPRARQGGRRLARRADRDRRRVPPSRHHGARRLQAARGGHHQSHASRGLCRGDRAENGDSSSRSTRATTRSTGFTAEVDEAALGALAHGNGHAVDGRPWQRRAGRHGALRIAARADAARNARARRRRWSRSAATSCSAVRRPGSWSAARTSSPGSRRIRSSARFAWTR